MAIAVLTQTEGVFEVGPYGGMITGFSTDCDVRIRDEDGTYIRGSASAGSPLSGFYAHNIQWVGVPPNGSVEVTDGNLTLDY